MSHSARSSTDPNRTPVAQDVFTWCTKEKANTWHVVRNHNANGFVERVICKACGSEHKYKPALASSSSSSSGRSVIVRSANGISRSGGGSSSAKASSSSSRTAVPTIVSSASFEEMWLEGLKKWGDKPLRAFDPTTHFKVGEAVDHAVFGKGIVQTRRENRIDVLFKSGMKTLPSPFNK